MILEGVHHFVGQASFTATDTFAVKELFPFILALDIAKSGTNSFLEMTNTFSFCNGVARVGVRFTNLVKWFGVIISLNGIKVRVFFEKEHWKSTCTVIIRIIITFGNEIFL